jgi:hypothetical protein
MTTPGTKAVVELITGPYVKARITSGPFEGQRWFTLTKNVCRPEVFAKLESNPAALAKIGELELTEPETTKPETTKPETSKRSRRQNRVAALPEGTDLVLTDLVVNPSFTNFVDVDGKFRNTSNAQLKGMLVTISFEDRAGKLVRSSTAMCLPNTIEPGENGSFHALVENDARVARVKLDFKDLERVFKWVDQSGKDAHE